MELVVIIGIVALVAIVALAAAAIVKIKADQAIPMFAQTTTETKYADGYDEGDGDQPVRPLSPIPGQPAHYTN